MHGVDTFKTSTGWSFQKICWYALIRNLELIFLNSALDFVLKVELNDPVLPVWVWPIPTILPDYLSGEFKSIGES